MANEFIQGGDYELKITATDSVGAVIDLTSLNGYIFVIYYADGVVVTQYSKNTEAGFKPLVLTDEVNGIFSVRLQSVDTKKARLEKIFGELKLETADTNFVKQSPCKSHYEKRPQHQNTNKCFHNYFNLLPIKASSFNSSLLIEASSSLFGTDI